MKGWTRHILYGHIFNKLKNYFKDKNFKNLSKKIFEKLIINNKITKICKNNKIFLILLVVNYFLIVIQVEILITLIMYYYDIILINLIILIKNIVNMFILIIISIMYPVLIIILINKYNLEKRVKINKLSMKENNESYIKSQFEKYGIPSYFDFSFNNINKILKKIEINIIEMSFDIIFLKKEISLLESAFVDIQQYAKLILIYKQKKLIHNKNILYKYKDLKDEFIKLDITNDLKNLGIGENKLPKTIIFSKEEYIKFIEKLENSSFISLIFVLKELNREYIKYEFKKPHVNKYYNILIEFENLKKEEILKNYNKNITDEQKNDIIREKENDIFQKLKKKYKFNYIWNWDMFNKTEKVSFTETKLLINTLNSLRILPYRIDTENLRDHIFNIKNKYYLPKYIYKIITYKVKNIDELVLEIKKLESFKKKLINYRDFFLEKDYLAYSKQKINNIYKSTYIFIKIKNKVDNDWNEYLKNKYVIDELYNIKRPNFEALCIYLISKYKLIIMKIKYRDKTIPTYYIVLAYFIFINIFICYNDVNMYLWLVKNIYIYSFLYIKHVCINVINIIELKLINYTFFKKVLYTIYLIFYYCFYIMLFFFKIVYYLITFIVCSFFFFIKIAVVFFKCSILLIWYTFLFINESINYLISFIYSLYKYILNTLNFELFDNSIVILDTIKKPKSEKYQHWLDIVNDPNSTKLDFINYTIKKIFLYAFMYLIQFIGIINKLLINFFYSIPTLIGYIKNIFIYLFSIFVISPKLANPILAEFFFNIASILKQIEDGYTYIADLLSQVILVFSKMFIYVTKITFSVIWAVYTYYITNQSINRFYDYIENVYFLTIYKYVIFSDRFLWFYKGNNSFFEWYNIPYFQKECIYKLKIWLDDVIKLDVNNVSSLRDLGKFNISIIIHIDDLKKIALLFYIIIYIILLIFLIKLLYIDITYDIFRSDKDDEWFNYKLKNFFKILAFLGLIFLVHFNAYSLGFFFNYF